jgi:fermentation-respiration switch protein FrsA (DUF1100 family)
MPLTAKRFHEMALIALVVYVALCVFMFFNQRSFIYFPDRSRPNIAAANLERVEVIAVQPADADFSIEGWYIQPRDADKPVILYFHGNAGNISIRAPRARALAEAGYGVLLAEYRGYGGNPGKPSEKGFYEDAMAYYNWLIQRGNFKDSQIVVYGESLGTGVATWLAAQRPNLAAVILEAPYTSLTDLGRMRFFFMPVDLLMRDRYTTSARIPGITSPLLILHGRRDMVVPVRYGQKVFDLANQPKTIKIFPSAGHSDLYSHGAADEIVAFLSRL